MRAVVPIPADDEEIVPADRPAAAIGEHFQHRTSPRKLVHRVADRRTGNIEEIVCRLARLVDIIADRREHLLGHAHLLVLDVQVRNVVFRTPVILERGDDAGNFRTARGDRSVDDERRGASFDLDVTVFEVLVDHAVNGELTGYGGARHVQCGIVRDLRDFFIHIRRNGSRGIVRGRCEALLFEARLHDIAALECLHIVGLFARRAAFRILAVRLQVGRGIRLCHHRAGGDAERELARIVVDREFIRVRKAVRKARLLHPAAVIRGQFADRVVIFGDDVRGILFEDDGVGQKIAVRTARHDAAEDDALRRAAVFPLRQKIGIGHGERNAARLVHKHGAALEILPQKHPVPVVDGKGKITLRRAQRRRRLRHLIGQVLFMPLRKRGDALHLARTVRRLRKSNDCRQRKCKRQHQAENCQQLFPQHTSLLKIIL